VTTADMPALAGRRMPVTGGTRGIGRELVTQLARKGAVVHFFGRSQVGIDAATAAVEGVVGHVADLALANDRRTLVDAVVTA